VTITERDSVRTLYLDGLHQSNDSPWMVRIHREIGHLPMALHPAPREALVIGLGAGATAGAVAQHTGVQVDLVELSQPVVRAAPFFAHINGAIVERPNVRLRIDDARNHLLLTSARYDVITADIIEPIQAGAGNLYSREYFTLVRHALRENGLVLQWIGRRPTAEYLLILRTFLNVFPEATLWADGSLLVGGIGPLRIDPGAFERKLADETTRAALSQVGMTSTESLMALYTAGPEELRRFAGPGPLLTDDRPALEFFRSLTRGELVDVATLRGDVRRHLEQ
jgi:spermidine synthase